jgi:ribosomal protein S18 acetylase RimI-like enzyme
MPEHTESDEIDLSITRIQPSDAGEVLTVQRAAFASEAIIYGDPAMPPMVQTLEELEAELRTADGWVARVDGRLVGAIRVREDDDLLLIGRIAIAPDMQGSGIGRALLDAAETHSDATQAELFTGKLSEANLRLYENCGYRETERVDGEIYLRKTLR